MTRRLEIWALILVVLGARLALVGFAGSDLPYWDQWFLEFRRVVLPGFAGTLQVSDLVLRTHNEHHLLYQRLLTLGVLWTTGRWEPWIEAIAASIVRAFELALVFHIVGASLSRFGRRTFLLLLIALGATPAAPFNLLYGFGFQHFLGEAFQLLILATLCAARPTRRQGIAAALLVVGSFLNMATVLITLAAAGATLALRFVIEGRKAAWAAVASAGTLCAALPLFAITPSLRGLTAQSMHDLTTALAQTLAWPLPGVPPIGLLVVTAPLALLARLRRRPDDSTSWLLLALCLASLGQALGIALGRSAALTLPYGQYAEGLGMSFVLAVVAIARVVELEAPAAARSTRPILGLLSVSGVALVVAGALLRGGPEVRATAEAARTRHPLFARALESGDFHIFEAESAFIAGQVGRLDFRFLAHPLGRFAIPERDLGDLSSHVAGLRAVMPARLVGAPPSALLRMSLRLAGAGPVLLLSGLALLGAALFTGNASPAGPLEPGS